MHGDEITSRFIKEMYIYIGIPITTGMTRYTDCPWTANIIFCTIKEKSIAKIVITMTNIFHFPFGILLRGDMEINLEYMILDCKPIKNFPNKITTLVKFINIVREEVLSSPEKLIQIHNLTIFKYFLKIYLCNSCTHELEKLQLLNAT